MNQVTFPIYYQQEIRIIIPEQRQKINLFHTKHNFFKNYFSPSIVIEWSKLDFNIGSAAGLGSFKENLLKFVRPPANSF